MHAMQSPLKLGPIPKRLYLQRGQVLTCAEGCLWITSDVMAGFGRDSDVVLKNGQYFVTLQTATYFVGAPFGWGVLSFSFPDALVRLPLEKTC